MQHLASKRNILYEFMFWSDILSNYWDDTNNNYSLYSLHTLGSFMGTSYHDWIRRYNLIQGAVKVMAKDLIRTRHQIDKFYRLKSQLQGVSLRIQVHFEYNFPHFIENIDCGYLLNITLIRVCIWSTMNLISFQTLKSTQAMGEAMKGVTKAMGKMNKQMKLPTLQKIMREFEKQNEKMEMVSEVMGVFRITMQKPSNWQLLLG